jgi:hypothetical protein
VNDPNRLRRFEQEAKTLAALNPNVPTIYDAGAHADVARGRRDSLLT